MATFDDAVIALNGDKLYRFPFTIDDQGTVSLGTEEAIENHLHARRRGCGGFLVGPVGGQESAEPDGPGGTSSSPRRPVT